MFDNAKTGMKHSIPITTNFKVLKYFSISAGGNYEESWVLKTTKYNDYNEGNGVVEEEVTGFDRFMRYHFSASGGTTIYGTINFKPK